MVGLSAKGLSELELRLLVNGSTQKRSIRWTKAIPVVGDYHHSKSLPNLTIMCPSSMISPAAFGPSAAQCPRLECPSFWLCLTTV